jgi:predicted PurR-regulated permease PerM
MADLNPAPPRPAAKPDALTPKFMTTVIAAVVVGGIYLGRPVLMPLALAVLISFALAPLVALLKKVRLGNVAPVLISLLFGVVIFSSLAGFMGSQLAKLAADLPRYQANLTHKIQSVVGSATHNNTINRLNHTLNNLAEQVTGSTRTDDGTTTEPNQIKPIPVVVTRSSLAP